MSKENIPIRENNEKLIRLSGLSNKIIVAPYYFKQGIPGAINECYLRESVVEKLLKATKYLPDNHYFHVFDAWRPYEVQQNLYEKVKNKFLHKGLKSQVLEQELAKYVSKPSKDPTKPSNHLTGGAVDLTIATDRGFLPMGTEFDEFTKASQTDTYENLEALTDKEILFRMNRSLLKSVMEQAGFSNYPEEWWHYDYGNQNWAYEVGNPSAYYSSIALDYEQERELNDRGN